MTFDLIGWRDYPDRVLTAEDFAALQVKNRPRDTLLKSTERGPHRDDLELLLNGRPARQFASEGQQRCLVIALRLAQAREGDEAHEAAPPLLHTHQIKRDP